MLKDWQDFAEWWNRKQGNEGDLWHRSLIDPAVAALLADVTKKEVLDLGCGNGYFSRRLAHLGAYVTGIDSSRPIIEIARQYEIDAPKGIQYHVADASDLRMLPDSRFDIILANMVLDDVENAEGAIKECSRVLREKGRLVASISHPCFDMGRHSGWQIEKIGLESAVWRKTDSNYRKIFSDTIEWKLSETERMETRWYHRPLSWYVRTLRNAGFVITRLEEPEPSEEFLKNSNQPWIEFIPMHCVLEATKMTF